MCAQTAAQSWQYPTQQQSSSQALSAAALPLQLRYHKVWCCQLSTAARRPDPFSLLEYWQRHIPAAKRLAKQSCCRAVPPLGSASSPQLRLQATKPRIHPGYAAYLTSDVYKVQCRAAEPGATPTLSSRAAHVCGCAAEGQAPRGTVSAALLLRQAKTSARDGAGAAQSAYEVHASCEVMMLVNIAASTDQQDHQTHKQRCY